MLKSRPVRTGNRPAAARRPQSDVPRHRADCQAHQPRASSFSRYRSSGAALRITRAWRAAPLFRLTLESSRALLHDRDVPARHAVVEVVGRAEACEVTEAVVDM